MIKKATMDLEGCEKKIRSACASEMTQRDWCEIWAKAKSEAKKGRYGFLIALLPIVARKMPETMPVQFMSFKPSDVPVNLLDKIQGESEPNAISH